MNARSTTMNGPNFLDALLALPRMLLQGVEAMMGRMGQGMMPPPGMPPARPGPAAPAFSSPPAAALAPPAFPVPLVPASPPPAAVALALRRDAGGAAGGLEESGVKLVEYAIVSVRRGAERILPGAGGQVMVTEAMSAETFATWIVAVYVQSRGPIPPEDRKYLRVAARVLDRWERQPLRFEGLQLLALEGIRRAIVDCCDDLPSPVSGGRARAALPAAPGVVLPAAPAAAPSEEGKRVLAALKKFGDAGGATSELVRESGLTQKQVRDSERELLGQGRIRRSGQGLKTRYYLVEPPPKKKKG